MGIFEKIFGGRKDKAAAAAFFKTLTAYNPTFITRAGMIYESEIVRSAIDARARHIAKLKIEFTGSAQPKLRAKLEKDPNPFQSWYQFLYRTSTILDMQNTAFIVPMESSMGETDGYFPVLPSVCELRELGGVTYLRYHFLSGDWGAIEFDRCAVLTKFQYTNDIFGETNGALAPTVELIDVQNQGIQAAVKNAAAYRFMARVGNFSFAEDLKKERKRFSEENFGKEAEAGGILLFPNTYSDIKQVQNTPYTADAAQLGLIRTNVFNYFGVNEKILQNSAFGDEWNAFYEGAVEPFAIQFSEQMTKALFTTNERAHGSGLMATSNRLQYLSNKEKLSVSTQLADRGVLNRDEVREIWNLPPIPDGTGQTYTIRGEYKNAEDVENQSKKGNDDESDKD